jgi:hypothetical protein
VSAAETKELRVVDNRVFLLGLDDLYRSAMKRNEGLELLRCAREVAWSLHVKPADVPVEGYYAEDARLTEYFRLVRALQEEPNSRVAAVEGLPAYQRLYAVTSSRLFGFPRNENKLLPVGHDAFSDALQKLAPHWTIPTLTAAAEEAAGAMDDYSLVGLAARAEDPVVLAALRESVVLYAETMFAGMSVQPPIFEWRVDAELADQADRFIHAFHALFPQGARLPAATAENAGAFSGGFNVKKIVGRCVRVGYDDTRNPVMHYHWGITQSQEGLEVEEFWAPEIWTTERYRRERAYNTPGGDACLPGLDGLQDLNL